MICIELGYLNLVGRIYYRDTANIELLMVVLILIDLVLYSNSNGLVGLSIKKYVVFISVYFVLLSIAMRRCCEISILLQWISYLQKKEVWWCLVVVLMFRQTNWLYMKRARR